VENDWSLLARAGPPGAFTHDSDAWPGSGHRHDPRPHPGPMTRDGRAKSTGVIDDQVVRCRCTSVVLPPWGTARGSPWRVVEARQGPGRPVTDTATVDSCDDAVEDCDRTDCGITRRLSSGNATFERGSGSNATAVDPSDDARHMTDGNHRGPDATRASRLRYRYRGWERCLAAPRARGPAAWSSRDEPGSAGGPG
jgi:hypothetical protein